MPKVVCLLQAIARTLWSGTGERTGIKGFHAFDGLRGYMAWWVVIGHGLHLCGLQNIAPAFLSSGDHAVNVFVSLSGFVISHLLLERREPYGRYLVRRAFRIFPIYWFALVCALLLAQMYGTVYAGDWVFQHEMRAARAIATEAEFSKYFLLHVSLLHGLVPDTWLPFSSTAFLAPAWSLSLEWQFYLVAPFVVAGLARPGISRLLTLLLLSAAWVLFKKVLPLQWQYPAVLPLSIHFFMLGILSRVFLPVLSNIGFWLLPVVLLMAGLAPHSVSTEVAVWGVFLAAACLQLRTSQAKGDIQAPSGFSRLLEFVTSNSAARWLGEFSYSTYLIHIALFSLVGGIAAKLGGAWTQHLAMVSTSIAIVLLIPLSYWLYRFIEKPFIRWGAALAKPKGISLKAG
ncbi:MAG: acyltransferase [Burkholderiaceae bacterium]|nr:acyltransferase [Burkholderiaceae bacterium]